MSTRHRTSTTSNSSRTDHPTLALTEGYDEEIAPLLTAIDRIRNRVADIDATIDLPAIVVIGEQSSGKSSVLEALSGILLPRGGQQMTTKCPLELRMRRAPTWHASLECPGRPKRDNLGRHEISQCITDAQNYLTGNRDQISKEVLVLNVQDPSLPNLTLIDLPGIIQVTSKQQARSSVDVIQELIREYLDKPSTIILAIIQACNDIETSAAIRYAKEADPDGERTVGVLTKPDLVDRGAEQKLLEVLENKRIPLKLGYLMVKCRTQEDIDERIQHSDALRKEEQFFAKSPKFHTVPTDRRGAPALGRFLTRELVRSIKQAVPRLITDLRAKINHTEQQFRQLGVEDYTQLLLPTEARSRHLTEKLFAAMQLFRTEIHGVEEGAQVNNPLYARRNELNQRFYNDMRGCRLENHQLVQSIRTAMIATQGPEPSDYILFRVTKTVCQQYIKAIRAPMEHYLRSMLERTHDVIATVINKVFQTRPNLLVEMRAMHEALEQQLKSECKRELELMLEMEESFVYADHPLYKDALKRTKSAHRSHSNETGSTTTTVMQSARLPLTPGQGAMNSTTTAIKRTNGVLSEDNDDDSDSESRRPVKVSRPNPASTNRPTPRWNPFWSSAQQETLEPHPTNNQVSRPTTDSSSASSRPTITSTAVDQTDEEVIEYTIRVLAMQEIICERILLTFPQRIEFQLVRKQFSQLDLQSSILSSTSLEKLDTLMAQDADTERRQNDLIAKRKLYDETIKELQGLDRFQMNNDSGESR